MLPTACNPPNFSPSNSSMCLGGQSKKRRPRMALLGRKSRAGSMDEIDDMDPDRVAELDRFLHQLAEIYPEHDVGICRQRLLEASRESQLAAAADALADVDTEFQNRDPSKEIEPWQRVRSNRYKSAVRKALSAELGAHLSDSTIKAVLAENNHDYWRSRESLEKIKSKSWRAALVNFFSWKTSRKAKTDGPAVTGCEELDDEISRFANSQRMKEQLESDSQFAQNLNEQQYQAEGALFECQCCYGDYTWEDISFCTDSHYFCRSCLKRSVEESLYGQGSGIDFARGTFRCISSSATCPASISPLALPHFLAPDLHEALEGRLAKAELDKCDLPILRCPFCPFAVEDYSRPSYEPKGFITIITHASAYVACMFFWGFDWWTMATHFTLTVFFLHGLTAFIPASVRAELNMLAQQTHRPSWQTILRCQNPACKRSSCIRCGRAWVGFHNCSDAASNKQAFVAHAMDEALKRTCPQCNTAFLKSGGCNKMTCPCGYKMCYLCRADVRVDQYNHFCQHFRAVLGQPCAECDHCLLFQDEKEDEVLQAAQIEAEREWEARQQEKGITRPNIPVLDDAVPGARLKGWDQIIFGLCQIYRL